MENFLEIELRESIGKGPARRIRSSGRLPGGLYGAQKSVAITVNPRSVHALLMQEGGKNKVLILKGSGLEGRSAMIKDFQVDPVSRGLLHVDLLEIDLQKKVRVTVKLNFVGRAEGVADVGVMNIVERAIVVNWLHN